MNNTLKKLKKINKGLKKAVKTAKKSTKTAKEINQSIEQIEEIKSIINSINPLSENPNPKDEVFAFCKKNKISVSWDFNRRLGVVWNEIYMDDELLMQIDQGITLKQFLRVIKKLNKDFDSNDFPHKPGEKKFDFTCKDKELFNKFVKKYKTILFKK